MVWRRLKQKCVDVALRSIKGDESPGVKGDV